MSAGPSGSCKPRRCKPRLRGQRAAIKGHYRLIDQPDDSAVTPDNLLEPHRQRTLRRMQAERVVLCVQDGTDLHFATHPGCAGLGLIGKNRGSEGTLGIPMHTTTALNPEGLPLGLLKVQYATPDGQAEPGRPIEERKTFQWIQGLRDCAAVARQLPDTQLVAVMDREADVQALLAEQRQLRRVELLVRARHNRSLGPDQPKLFDPIRSQAAQARIEIEVPRSSARRGSRQQAAKPLREARTARVEVRWQTVVLPPPAPSQKPLRLQCVHVWERSPAPAGEALEWFLLTTLPVTSLADAERVLRWYRLRWRIEDWHRILQSGCQAESLGHRTSQRLMRAVTIKAVIAWRLALMTLLGRTTPEMSASVCFTPQQLRVLRDFTTHYRLEPPRNLGLAVRTMAILGGYLDRPNAPPPGHQTIWEGWTRLSIMSATYTLCLAYALPVSVSIAEP